MNSFSPIIMDFIKKAAEGMKGKESGSGSSQSSSGDQDYVDKGRWFWKSAPGACF